MNRILMLVLESFLVAVLFGSGTDAFVVDRRSAASERNSDDYPDYQLGVKYDEYPVRTLLFLFRPSAKAPVRPWPVSLKSAISTWKAQIAGLSQVNAIKLELSFRVFSSCPAAKARWCKLPGLFLIRIGVASRCTCCTADSAPIRRIWKNFGHDKAWNVREKAITDAPSRRIFLFKSALVDAKPLKSVCQETYYLIKSIQVRYCRRNCWSF